MKAYVYGKIRIRNGVDKLFTIANVGGVRGGDAFLFSMSSKTILIDTGFAFSAEKTVKNLEKELDGRSLDYVLLTHTHYDHASGCPYIKARWPESEVVAGEYAGKIFSRSSALRIMDELNTCAAKHWGCGNYPPAPCELSVDRTVKEGEIIDLGEYSLRVIEVPGHTKCSIAFFCEEERLLIGSETFGIVVDDSKHIVPYNLVGYQMTLDSIEKAASYNPEHLFMPHYGIISGEKTKRFFERAYATTVQARNLVVDGYKKGMTKEELIELLKCTYFTETLAKFQPVEAFVLNASYMVPMIVRECLGEEIVERASIKES